ncbi:unnamed protein product [Cuscuta campestris]|uniref:Uncharacterized protein n=1 Tax=Cuscuta campestris TaxID=132261 RepID=A0A484LUQ9_9ASTE|nr:unnamed protein product [Cuscuta campestris]
MRQEHKAKIRSILGIRCHTREFTYLGSVIVKGKLGKIHCQGLLQKFERRIAAWYSRKLNQMGRLILIKYVLSSIPLHILVVQEIPRSIVKCLHMLMANFFWGARDMGHKYHWRKWEKLCFPLLEGGLGVRDLGNCQRAAAMDLWWKIKGESYGLMVFIPLGRFMLSPLIINLSSCLAVIFGIKGIFTKEISGLWCTYAAVAKAPIAARPWTFQQQLLSWWFSLNKNSILGNVRLEEAPLRKMMRSSAKASALVKPSEAMMKSRGDNGSPCLSPLVGEKGLVDLPLKLIAILVLETILLMSIMNLGLNPKASKISFRANDFGKDNGESVDQDLGEGFADEVGETDGFSSEQVMKEVKGFIRDVLPGGKKGVVGGPAVKEFEGRWPREVGRLDFKQDGGVITVTSREMKGIDLKVEVLDSGVVENSVYPSPYFTKASVPKPKTVASSFMPQQNAGQSNAPLNAGSNQNIENLLDVAMPAFMAEFLQHMANAPMFQLPPPPQRQITFKTLKENRAEEFLGD